MRKFNEVIAVNLVFLAIGGTIGAIFFYESVRVTKRNTIDLEARPISTWSPKEIRVKKGELVRIRVINKDCVTHGFAIPALGVESGDIKSGHQVIEEFTPQKIGEYDFYCTAWCSEHHLQMRGVLVVVERSAMPKTDR